MAFQVKPLAVLFDEKLLIIEAEARLMALVIAFNRYNANGI